MPAPNTNIPKFDFQPHQPADEAPTESNFEWFAQGGDGVSSRADHQPVRASEAHPDEVDYYGLGLNLKHTAKVDQGVMSGELPRDEITRMRREAKAAAEQTHVNMTPVAAAKYGRRTWDPITSEGPLPPGVQEVSPEAAAKYHREALTEGLMGPVLFTHRDRSTNSGQIIQGVNTSTPYRPPADAQHRTLY
jgi:hypothetical protein